jgi:predicted PurR-regulated permease PerM
LTKVEVIPYSGSRMERRFINYLLKHQVIMALVLIVLAWFLYLLRNILISLFIAYILMASLLPLVRYLQTNGLPRIVSALIAYLLIILLLVLLFIPLIPFFIIQVQSLILNFPAYLDQSATSLGIDFNYHQLELYLSQQLDSIGSNAFIVTKEVFGGLFSLLTVLIVSFYLLLDHEILRKRIAAFFPRDDRPRVFATLKQVDERLGAWLRGQLFLCFFIGLLSWILLSLLQVPNALPLAVVAGLLEALPTIGPIISSIPAIIVAFTISPPLALAVAIGYTIIQLLENNIIVPKIMEHAVGLNPIVIILAIMTGAELMGIPGALLSIPFVSFLIVLFNSIQGEEGD